MACTVSTAVSTLDSYRDSQASPVSVRVPRCGPGSLQTGLGMLTMASRC
ncbi:Uncharacterised protein [Mycobacteroides abscessus subsp. abscessus]|nr:Uncharacterised protein [Mycobacteroides abscessus subsp. abscessus]SIL62878.1 Uncharacterised protein [Mycobacteroides abscessus subsp. abscessus]